MNRQDFLQDQVQQIDIKSLNIANLVNAFSQTAFQARNLGRAANIYDQMISDPDCAIILCLAGSLFSAGLKGVVCDLINHNMVDAIVSTGANIVDQDFFEALGFHHYVGDPFADDEILRQLRIDRIYDTYIDEDQLRVCDMTLAKLADSLEKRPYSSREFIEEMGAYLEVHGKTEQSVVLSAYRHQVPIFVPAFSDCSAGFGLVYHQWNSPESHLTIDSVRDFKELTQCKLSSAATGLLMIGGGVPKNFAQDTVVAAELLGFDTSMHKYTVQITVADERDGGLSGSTLKEAHSWGKVDKNREQMVFSEATLAFPLVAGYAYEQQNWRSRSPRHLANLFHQSLTNKSLAISE
ncbi:1,9-bis(guanidino)-5-aza-nonane synthase [Crocosphaera chwakensis]|uniref:Deoxyhypusine synthase-like protein n=1 Tax=Crocosphaera chwakensis CCY0110 TaxID=391612 RepID=A3ILP9_9CHRO|nr:deoxyhypusine synthase [Crocosphaera chwakensis]EAZ92700.1 deoxyhypusine synthase-like protein [Crocosphaera chwakensis CCY0110]